MGEDVDEEVFDTDDDEDVQEETMTDIMREGAHKMQRGSASKNRQTTDTKWWFFGTE